MNEALRNELLTLRQTSHVVDTAGRANGLATKDYKPGRHEAAPRACARYRRAARRPPASEKIGQFGAASWRIDGRRGRPRSAFGLARGPPFGHPSEVARRVDHKDFRPFITRCDGRKKEFAGFP